VVKMNLAYAPGRPEGDLDDRLELHVPLTPQGHIDDQAVATAGQSWPGRRLRPDGTERSVELVAVDSGWALRSARSEDEPLWAMEGRVFRPGELVTLRRPSGEDLVFRVVNVEAE